MRATVPTFEPVTLVEAKKQVELPLDETRHDDSLKSLIASAREQVEHDTAIVCCSASYTLKLTNWPCHDYIELPVRPVTSVVSIVYAATDGTPTTWSSSNYVLSTSSVRPVIRLAYQAFWPTSRGWHEDITVTFLAGYTSPGGIPQLVKQACLLDIARNFRDREGEMDLDKFARAYEMLVRRLQRSNYP